MEIPNELVEEIRDTLSYYKFSDGGYTNNDEVIELCDKLDIIIQQNKDKQQ